MSSNTPANNGAANIAAAANALAAAEANNTPKTLENVLGVVGASGYMKNLGPGVRALTKSTWRGNNVLLRGANVLEKYPDPKDPRLVVTRLQAAAKAGNLETVLQVLKQLGAQNPKARQALVSQILLDEHLYRSPLILAEFAGHEPIVRALFSVKPRPPAYFDYKFLLEGAYMTNNTVLINDLLYRGAELFPYFQYTYTAENGSEQTGSYAPANDEQRFILKRDVFLDALQWKNYNLLINFFHLNRELFPEVATTQDTVTGFFGPPVTIERPTTFFEHLALKYDYYTPAKKDELAPLEYLILMGITSTVNVNSTVRGKSLLSYFLSRGSHSERIVNTILENPMVDVNQVNNDGSTPLYTAVQGSIEEVVNILLEKGATDVRVEDYRKSSTVLLEAVHNVAYSEGSVPLRGNYPTMKQEKRQKLRTKYMKSRRILESLINHNFDVNYASSYGKTPLMGAVAEGSLRLVQYLLTIPTINVNAKDSMGRTAAYYLTDAVNTGNLISVRDKDAIQAILRALVKAGLNLESEDDNYDTALDYFTDQAAAQDFFIPLVEAVHNFKVNEPSALNTGPLPYAPNESNFQGGRRHRHKTHKRRGKAKTTRKTK